MTPYDYSNRDNGDWDEFYSSNQPQGTVDPSDVYPGASAYGQGSNLGI